MKRRIENEGENPHVAADREDYINAERNNIKIADQNTHTKLLNLSNKKEMNLRCWESGLQYVTQTGQVMPEKVINKVL